MSRNSYNNMNGYKNKSISLPQSTIQKEEYTPKQLTIQKTRKTIKNTRNPNVWGPGLWSFLHISSINYIPDSIEKRKMTRDFIISLPFMLPCNDCSEHAKKYVADSTDKLNEICSSRDNLFRFYVDFHNFVNFKHHKKMYSYQEAWDQWGNGAEILTFTF
jgi:hypothetical protein